MADKKIDLKTFYDNPILVYGIGRIGKTVVRGLKALQANIIGIAVTSLSAGDATEFEKTQIRTIENWKDYSHEAVILISTGARFFDEIKKNCISNGFDKVITASGDLKELLYSECYSQWATERGLSLKDSTFQIAGGGYINPFVEEMPDKSDIAAYWDEMGDFVFPAVYNDYSITVEGPYEFGEVRLSKGDTVLDLGSNLGLFSVYAASRDCVSYAFEPMPDLRRVLKRHSALNCGRIKVVPYAVSNTAGQTMLYLDANSSSNNSLLADWTDGGTALNVRQITVDEFVSREKLDKVDFIKADIEGAERLMLEGAQNTLRNFAPKLALCTYHLPDDKEVMTELILKANPNYSIEYKWKKLYAHI